MQRAAGLLLALGLLLVLSFAAAQDALRIDGRDAGTVRSDLVPGTSYGALDRIAAVLDLEVVRSPGTRGVILRRGGRILSFDEVEEGVSPLVSGGLQRDGVPFADLAAVRSAEGTWVPVAALARALYADVAYLATESTVVVVTPRPYLESFTLDAQGGSDVATLRFSAPLALETRRDAATGTTELTVLRTSMERAMSENGTRLRRVAVFPRDGHVVIRVEAPGVEVDVIPLADGIATTLVLRARANDGVLEAREPSSGVRLAIEAGVTGEDPYAAAALLDLATSLAEQLAQRAVPTTLVRATPAPAGEPQRLAAAVTSDLYLVVHEAALPSGEVRIWTLGEAASEELNAEAVRRNAVRALADAGATDALRRELLLGLVPDVSIGQRAAETLAASLYQTGGFRAGTVQRAPLAVLEAAAGRGVLIEVARADLASLALLDALVEALAGVVAATP